MRRQLSLQDFKGHEDLYYNFKRLYEQSRKNLTEASLSAGFFCPSEVFDILASEGMNIEFKD